MKSLFIVLTILCNFYVSYAQNAPFLLLNNSDDNKNNNNDTLQHNGKSNGIWSYRLSSFSFTGGNNGTEGKTKNSAKSSKKATLSAPNNLSVEQYINQYSAIAISEMQRTQVPASITLAQGILESSAGNSYLTRKAQNHFGILCHKDWKGRQLSFFQNGKKRSYRAYSSGYASYIDHSNFIENRDQHECHLGGI